MMPLLLPSFAGANSAASAVPQALAIGSGLPTEPESDFSVSMAKATAPPAVQGGQTGARASATSDPDGDAKNAQGQRWDANSGDPSISLLLAWQGQAPLPLIEAEKPVGPPPALVSSQSGAQSRLKTLLGFNSPPTTQSAALEAKIAAAEKPLLTSGPQSDGDEATPIKYQSDVPADNASLVFTEDSLSDQRYEQTAVSTAAGPPGSPEKLHPVNASPARLSAAPGAKIAAAGKSLLSSESKGDAETLLKFDDETPSVAPGGIGELKFPAEFKSASPQLEAARQTAEVLLAPLSGTGVALGSAQMKLLPEQDEFAQITTQKLSSQRSSLPGAGQSDGPTDKASLALAVDFVSDKPFEQVPINNTAGAMAGLDAMPGTQTEGILATTTLPARIEQVQGLVTREILMVRQSGADTLAVSLKIDSHTDLLLQLTNHNGQIEAAVRCERGDLASLNSHWGQLQESLARQNVHLQPLEDRSGSRVPLGVLEASSSPAQNFDQQNPSRNHPSPLGEADETSPSEPRPSAATAVNKPQTRKTPPKGWESWA
jgi:hypothetical protein